VVNESGQEKLEIEVFRKKKKQNLPNSTIFQRMPGLLPLFISFDQAEIKFIA
jgi:hypothetical protein